ncbi:TPA: hypothetical protein JG832_002502 [Enterobacter hormaechei subsp. xiangfangensis]|nr:hypothetical protein [Enterobacter hormaechei subsp. xiangfangensis]HAV1890637.1 hypothetical protein [Enterobacter hormaechei subsp. xiangfangensis]
MDRPTFMTISGLTLSQSNIWYPLINKAMRINGIIEKKERALFLAVILGESNGLTRTVDNMTYSVNELKREFSGCMTTYQAEMLGGNAFQEPKCEAVANLVYAHKYGNSGIHDGWKYRPRGLIPVIGVNNYSLLGRIYGIDLVGSPELMEKPDIATQTAGYLWRTKGANRLETLSALCQLFNGRSTEKLKSYLHYYALACKGLSVK